MRWLADSSAWARAFFRAARTFYWSILARAAADWLESWRSGASWCAIARRSSGATVLCASPQARLRRRSGCCERSRRNGEACAAIGGFRCGRRVGRRAWFLSPLDYRYGALFHRPAGNLCGDSAVEAAFGLQRRLAPHHRLGDAIGEARRIRGGQAALSEDLLGPER